MIGAIHILSGVVVGQSFDNSMAVAVIAFFSHYLLDLLPHIDSETFTDKKHPYTWKQVGIIIIDFILIALIIASLFFSQRRFFAMLIGALSSIMPDILMPLERYRLFWPLRRFHSMFHWDRRQARQWPGYIAALVTPAMVAAFFSAVSWWMW